MHLLSNRLLLIVLLIPVLFLMGLTGYKSWNAFQDFREHSTAYNALQLLETADHLGNTIVAENLLAADQNASRSAGLKTIQAQTDSLLEALQTSKTLQEIHASDTLTALTEYIHLARNQLQKETAKPLQVHYDLYGIKSTTSLVDIFKKLIGSSDSLSHSQLLRIYTELMEQQLTVGTEAALMTHLVSRHQPMTPEAYEAWDNLLAHSALPSLEVIGDPTFSSRLKAVFESDTQCLPDPRQRAYLAAEGLHGTYSIASDRLYSQGNESQKCFQLARQKIMNKTLESSKNATQTSRQDALNYAFQTFLFLILIAILLYLIQKIAHDKRLLESTLKSIEFDLGNDKKEELQRIVQQRNTKAIYAFLTETIRESNKAKDLFLANMSHEIRTPLNGIVGFTQLLKTTPLNGDQEEFVHVIEESSEHLLNIVSDILDLSKIKAEKIEIEEVAFNLIDKVESAIETYGAKALQKDIDLSVYTDPSLPDTLIGDPTRVSQVLVNLVSNAIKFTNNYGEVSVFCERVQETEREIAVKFSVKDTGIGIAPEQQKRIFESFSQADSSTTRKFGGTGLGLSISNKLVELMGGKLEIESLPGEGATFYFTLHFQHDPEIRPAEAPSFPNLRVGLMLPQRNIDRQVDRNLETYIEYLGAKFTILYEDEITKMLPETLPDLLFVDQRYNRRDKDIARLMSLQTNIVIMAGGKNKYLEEIAPKFAAIIYKPLNYSKTLKTLKEFAGGKHTKPKEKAPQILFDNLKILVAEDNRINQKLIITTLEKFGIVVDIASNGQEAVMLRKQNEYDLIFMDIQMPVMNGIEATEEILRFESASHQKHVPIIALTANALRGDREKYLEAGMDNYTPKPIQIDHIQGLIQKYHPGKVRKIEGAPTETAAPSSPEHHAQPQETQAPAATMQAAPAEPEPPSPEPIRAPTAPVTPPSTQEPAAAMTAEQTEAPVVREFRDVLVYFHDPLVATIHLEVLEKERRCDVVLNEIDFLDLLDRKDYRNIIIRSDLVPVDDCYVANLLQERGTTLYVYGEENVPCPGVQTYASLHELREKLARSLEEN